MNQQNQPHIPVLAAEVVHYLTPNAGEHYLDLTAGYGGHARSVLERIGTDGRATLVDRDETAIKYLRAQFGSDQRVNISHSDFLSASQRLQTSGQNFDLILADLGLSSPHLDNASRGFSFSNEGPLDMRMDISQQRTAHEIVNTWSREELISILRDYGEIRTASKLADMIIAARSLQTTAQLASLIKQSTGNNPKVRLEAQVFQAIRIAVNEELGQLQQSLPLWHKLLRPHGRLAVISFHSLEDRLVKQYFQEHGGDRYDADLKILTRRPITSATRERLSNPRARSAKLRVVQRK